MVSYDPTIFPAELPIHDGWGDDIFNDQSGYTLPEWMGNVGAAVLELGVQEVAAGAGVMFETVGSLTTVSRTAVDIQEFFGPAAAVAGGANTIYSWVMPADAVAVEIEIVAGGGGGGSGRRGASGTVRGGGGGGASGNRARAMFAATDLSSAGISVIFWPGGLGGAARTTDADGAAGVAGGTVEFGAYLAASGGGAGQGGSTVGGSGGALGLRGRASGAAGGMGGGVAAAVAGSGGTLALPDASGGGGGGGGINASNANQEPGAGGPGPNYHTPQIAGGVAATISTPAGAGLPAGPYGGTGGGGSYRGSASNAAAAANGARGAGGGGGGAALTGVNSGAGGNGGPGFVRVVTYR